MDLKMLVTRRHHIVGVAAAIGVLGAGVAGASSFGGPAAAHHTHGARPVGAALVRYYPVLSRAHASTGAIALPAGIAVGVSSGLMSQYGIEPEAAVHVTYSAGFSAWVIPGSGGMCVYAAVAPYSGTCGPLADAEAGRLFFEIESANGAEKRYVGLAPNGNASVALTLADGTRTSIPVVGNVFEATVPDLSTITVKSGLTQTAQTLAVGN
jgi:hypothetical protein